MATVLPLLLAIAPLVVWFAYVKLAQWRRAIYNDVPHPPPSTVFGHLKLIGELMAKGHPKRHTDYVFHQIGQSLGSPPFYMLDLRPVLPPLCVLMSTEVAEQFSKSSSTFRYSTPKSPTIDEFMPVTGQWSILRMEGEEWKTLRKRFNAGFSTKHLHTLLPRIVEKTLLFMNNLDKLAATNEEFAFGDLCTAFTFDVIGAVTMDLDLGAQGPVTEQNKIVTYFQKLLDSFNNAIFYPTWYTAPFTMWYRRKYSMLVDAEIQKSVVAKFTELQSKESQSAQDSGRSVLSLSLNGVEKLTPETIQQTIDQLKTFLFAGHDTTATLLQWCFYELSRSPRILQTLRAELDAVLGPGTDPETVSKVLLEGGEELMSKLSYTSAIVKEGLRMYPPAGSARMPPPQSGFRIKTPDGHETCLDGVVIYHCHYTLHRDASVYGDTAELFLPERWVGNTNTSAEDDALPAGEKRPTEAKVPVTAWRPFERGPRNCIGQELANIEARVAIACLARRYDFHKVGMGSLVQKDGKFVLNAEGQYEVTEPLLNTRKITSKPLDNTMMKVRFYEKT